MQPKTTTPLHTPRMRRLRAGLWLIESKSNPGIGHKCTVDACGCPAGRHGKMCWHRRLVRRAEAWLAGYDTGAPLIVPATEQAPVPPVPAPVPATPPVAGDFHQSAGYLALIAAFE